MFNKNYEELDSLLKQAKKAMDKLEKDVEEETDPIETEAPVETQPLPEDNNAKQEAIQAYKSGRVNEAVDKVIESVKNKKEPNKGRVDETMVNVFFQDAVAQKLLTEEEVNAFKSLVIKRAGEVNGAVSADEQNKADAAEADKAMDEATENQAPADIENNPDLPGVVPNEEPLPEEDILPEGDDIEIDMHDTASIEDKTKKIASLLEDIKNYKPAKTKEEVILEVAASTNDAIEFLQKTAVALSEPTKSPEHAGREAFTDKTVTKEGGETPKFPGQKVMMENTQEVVSVYNTKGKPETDVFVDKAGRKNVTSINTGSGTIGFVQAIKLDEPVDIKGFSYKGAITGERAQQQPKDEGEKLAGAGHETENYYDKVQKVAPKSAESLAGKWPKEKKQEEPAVEATAAKEADLEKQATALGFTYITKKADAPIPVDNIQNGSTLGSDATLEPKSTDVIKAGTNVTAEEVAEYQKQQIKAFQEKENELAQKVVASEEPAELNKEAEAAPVEPTQEVQAEEAPAITTEAADNPSGDLEKQDPAAPTTPQTTEPIGQKESPLQQELEDLLNKISKEAPAEFSKFKSEANNPKLLKQDIIDYLKQKKQMLDADKFNVCDFDKLADKVFGLKKIEPRESATEKGKEKEEKKEKDSKDEGGDEDLPSLEDLLK